MSNYLLLLLILACPLMMIFMMRGMHAGRGDDADGGRAHRQHLTNMGDSESYSHESLDELRRTRDLLEREIEEREAAEEETLEPTRGTSR